MITDNQKNRAIEVMKEYLAAPPDPDGITPLDRQSERDLSRADLIRDELRPLLLNFLGGQICVEEFKTRNDSLNKMHGYWGFKGIKGQMFFNMLVKTTNDLGEIEAELRAALRVPDSEELARSRIQTFASFVRRLGDQFVEEGGSAVAKPKLGSIPYFLSYFWQVQDAAGWPVYYTSTVNTSEDLNLWSPKGDLAADYIEYKHLHEELGRIFSAESGREFGLYEVEHVFWFRGGNPLGGNTPYKPDKGNGKVVVDMDKMEVGKVLPESFVPPVVAVIPHLAANDSNLESAAKRSGISIPKALEKYTHTAFTILGYESRQYGQGTGRQPDGVAIDRDNSYVVIWDAKAYSSPYSLSTSDQRAIREYIHSFARSLKKKQSTRNIYFAIISASFADDFDDVIRMFKMETDVSEVVLIEAKALVTLVDLRLRDPLETSLGPDGVQRLFSSSGIVTPEIVREQLIG